MKKNSITTVFFLGTLILIGIGLSIYLSFFAKTNTAANPDSYKEESPSPSAIASATDAPSQTNAPTDLPTNSPTPTASSNSNKGDVYQKPPEKQLRVITSVEVESVERDARVAFRKLDFNQGLEVLQPVVSEVKSDENSKILFDLNADASLLALINPSDEESDGDERAVDYDNIFNNIHDPEMALLGVLTIDDISRRNVIVSKDSLDPLFGGDILILGQSKASDEDLHYLRLTYPDVTDLIRIDFSIEKHHLYANVMKDPKGFSKVFTIQAAEGEQVPYKTIQEWIKLDEVLKQGKSPSVQDNY